jgi:hypothetical protein
MKFLVSAVLLLVSIQGFAEEPKKVPVKEGYGTLDMSAYNKHTATQSDSGKSNISATTSCTDTAGMEHQQGDAAYDACLINAKPANGAIKSSKPGVGVKFGK